MSGRGPEYRSHPSRAGGPPGEALSGRRHVTVARARACPIPKGNLAAPVLAHGSLIVEYYAPRGTDSQTAHTRDEVYAVIAGRGWFVNGPERHPFEPGDVMFVPAGVVHRFEEFTDDFAVWVVFYGPEGGERP
ncbi:MAG TPA: cupin domain-containing protein [bacterium]|nr:cupin domain-containing protein [bacterium]